MATKTTRDLTAQITFLTRRWKKSARGPEH